MSIFEDLTQDDQDSVRLLLLREEHVFGSDLVLLMLVFNFAAILCQYLSARIAVVTGRDLSQICSEEYDKTTCIFLGVLTELSMIALDLTMILGTAQGLNLIFGADLFTCVFICY
ncbi:Ethylene-insensitive protein 2 [Camellia lanceoleosa]|uniref:Ethylene-insensitive protein 2 n=1 Tax=Camellia lanceoleosa TaxID=1840588 RepID=A0ACC0FCU3_9ERIC|nr:Ethylene-insensitive protein 2 [Camellia lanceoleosa]